VTACATLPCSTPLAARAQVSLGALFRLAAAGVGGVYLRRRQVPKVQPRPLRGSRVSDVGASHVQAQEQPHEQQGEQGYGGDLAGVVPQSSDAVVSASSSSGRVALDGAGQPAGGGQPAEDGADESERLARD
jgi:hypothetical protein